jgi:plastocyanin
VLSGCGGSGATKPVVTIKNFTFQPHQLAIRVGRVLTIRNNDPSLHGFATDNGAVVLGAVNPGGSRQAVFTKPGTYAYHCTVHLSMKGVLVVR